VGQFESGQTWLASRLAWDSRRIIDSVDCPALIAVPHLPGGADSMTNADADVLADASRQYGALRRRYWRFFLGIPVLLIMGCASSIPALNSVVRGLLIALLISGFLVCWTGGLFAWFSLGRFRCPRCGKRFMVRYWWTTNWPTGTCIHCGLRLD
jgi:hypothetical protein